MQARKPVCKSIAWCCLCAAAGLSLNAQASGFRIPEASISGLALSNAMVANPEDIGAFAYNPAAMSFHDGSSINMGMMLLRPDMEVRTDSGSHDGDIRENVFIPTFYGAYRLNDAWSLGLGVGAPYGLESNWDAGTFPVLSQPTTAALHPTKSKLELVAFSPSVAYRISPNASVSAGIDYYWATGLTFNSSGLDVQGDGSDWGWNLGFLYDLDRLSLGLTYHSSSSLEIEGKFQPWVALPGGPPPGTVIPAKANLDLPWYLQAGVRYEFTEALAVEFDYTRTGWSEFDEIRIVGDGRGADGVTLATSTNNWEDANAYRLGVSYQLTPRTQLRFGYTLDKTGQKDDFYSARVPDSDRNLFSLGVGHNLGDGWGLDAGYMYVSFDDRKINSNVPFGTYGGDPNGTNAYNGKYKAHVHIFGLGVSKSFE